MKIFSRILLPALLVILLALGSNAQSSGKKHNAPENHIQLEGEDNMRDLGGFVGVEGRKVKYRKLFRSGELSSLTPADQETLASLKIRQVIDLRNPYERMENPDNIPEHLKVWYLPLLSVNQDTTITMESELLSVLRGQKDGKEIMLPLYEDIDSLKLANWEQIFDILEKGKATLWHCTAGKDRAGMTTALVLSSLGVERETIIDDFMASNKFLSPYIEETVGGLNEKYGDGVGDRLRPLLGVDETYIRTFFQALDDEYGGVEKFLDKIGVDREKMRKRYLEKPQRQ